jgi:ribosomal protein S18 acetylase RimI-like enzyme
MGESNPKTEQTMRIRSLIHQDRPKLLSILIKTKTFTSKEIDVAMELIDIVWKDKDQKDYQIHCMVNDQDQVMGYICYGPIPMAERTFDLYWIVVAPGFQDQGVGSKLLDFLEEGVRRNGGRMILADTSSIPSYEKTRRFYLQKGFQEVARISDYYTQGNDRITYCKRLL